MAKIPVSVRFRIDFKVIMLTYKALHGLAPQNLAELLIPFTPSRKLRSQSGLLVVPKTRLCSRGDRVFSSYPPQLWNSLPADIREANSLDTFKSRLKTFYFRLSFLCSNLDCCLLVL